MRPPPPAYPFVPPPPPAPAPAYPRAVGEAKDAPPSSVGGGDPFELPPPGTGLPAAEYRAFWAAWDSWAGSDAHGAAGGPQ